ncbi:MAG: molecular chaperone Tir [bacterium]
MKRKIFISFRFDDGFNVKENLVSFLEKRDLIVNKSEDVDRSNMSDDSIEEYLFEKLRDTSITLVILTPNAINYKINHLGELDDWLYDELRYSLYERKGNTINGVIALYTEDAKESLMRSSKSFCQTCKSQHTSSLISDFNNLVRKNMMNVKPSFKKNSCDGYYDSNYDSYISLVAINDFMANPDHYLDIAYDKRKSCNQYNLVKRLS